MPEAPLEEAAEAQPGVQVRLVRLAAPQGLEVTSRAQPSQGFAESQRASWLALPGASPYRARIAVENRSHAGATLQSGA